MPALNRVSLSNKLTKLLGQPFPRIEGRTSVGSMQLSTDPIIKAPNQDISLLKPRITWKKKAIKKVLIITPTPPSNSRPLISLFRVYQSALKSGSKTARGTYNSRET